MKKITFFKFSFRFLFLLNCILLFNYCQPEPVDPYNQLPDNPLQIIKPEDPKEYTVAEDYKISILIQFNKPVDTSTVIVGETLLLQTGNDLSEIDARILWSDKKEKVTLLIDSPVNTWEAPGFYFCLKLLGTDAGIGAIKDTEGYYLDGDFDEVPEGDFEIFMPIPE